MKKILRNSFLLFVLSLLFACSNKAYLGTYLYSYYGSDSSYAKLDLKKDKSFTYYASSCMANCSSQKGVGSYTIKSDTIELNYLGNPEKNVPLEQNNKLISLKKRPTNSDIKLRIKAVEIEQGDTIPLIYAEILCATPLEKKGAVTSLEGIADFSLSTSDFPLKIEVRYVGYLPSTVILKEPFINYDLIILCVPSDGNMAHWLEGKQKFPILKQKDGLRISNMTKSFHPKSAFNKQGTAQE